MKKQITLFTLALFTIVAMAQTGVTKLRKTATITIDTALVDTPNQMGVISDSILDAKLSLMQNELIKNSEEQTKNILNKIRETNRQWNFFISALKNMIPIMPFVAAIFIAFFWFKNNYRRRIMRQELILKYIDREEVVPGWLTRSESGSNDNEPYSSNRANAKTFLTISIILAICTFIWGLISINTRSLGAIILSLIFCVAFGIATIYCFKQYIKRTL